MNRQSGGVVGALAVLGVDSDEASSDDAAASAGIPSAARA